MVSMFLMASLSALGKKYAFHEEEITILTLPALEEWRLSTVFCLAWMKRALASPSWEHSDCSEYSSLSDSFLDFRDSLWSCLEQWTMWWCFSASFLFSFSYLGKDNIFFLSVFNQQFLFLVSLACSCLDVCSVTQILACVTGRTLILSFGQLSQCSKWDFNAPI